MITDKIYNPLFSIMVTHKMLNIACPHDWKSPGSISIQKLSPTVPFIIFLSSNACRNMIQKKSSSEVHLSEMSEVFHHPQTVSTKTHAVDCIEKGQKYQLE